MVSTAAYNKMEPHSQATLEERTCSLGTRLNKTMHLQDNPTTGMVLPLHVCTCTGARVSFLTIPPAAIGDGVVALAAPMLASSGVSVSLGPGL